MVTICDTNIHYFRNEKKLKFLGVNFHKDFWDSYKGQWKN